MHLIQLSLIYFLQSGRGKETFAYHSLIRGKESSQCINVLKILPSASFLSLLPSQAGSDT